MARQPPRDAVPRQPRAAGEIRDAGLAPKILEQQGHRLGAGGVFGLFKISQLEQEVRARNEAVNLRLARQTADYLETMIQTRVELVSSLAGLIGSRDDWSPAQLQEVASRARDGISDVEYLTIAGPDSTSIVFVPSERPGHLAGQNYGDREYVQRMRTSAAPVVSDVIIVPKAHINRVGADGYHVGAVVHDSPLNA